MSRNINNKDKKVQARAVINKIKVQSLPAFQFSIDSDDIIPFGTDNLYPQRILEAISGSPTAAGCVKRMREFIFGNGVSIGGDVIVNTDGDTLNDVINTSVFDYSRFSGFAIHVNFNIFGKIVEITNVDFEYIRKLKNLEKVRIDNYSDNINAFFSSENGIEIDLYNPSKLHSLNDGFDEYKGQVFYWSDENKIYPTAFIDNSSVSASYEREAQIYPYANMKNGFSGNTIVKYPTMKQGEEAQLEKDDLSEQLGALHGADRAGSSLVVSVPVNVSGDVSNHSMIEHLTPTNIDGLFVNQNKKAESDILKSYTMPKILLGQSDQGMFNQASFNDAFNYKNADYEGDRKKIERQFNQLLSNSIYPIPVNLTPLEMKKNV